MKKQDAKIKRRLAEYVAEQKQLDETGSDPGAHLRWALSQSVLVALEAGYQITDLDCFRQDPRYTGGVNQRQKAA